MIAFLSVFLFAAICSNVLAADEPKYRNPNPKFKPQSQEEIARLEKVMLGTQPQLSARELEKLNEGDVVVRKISDSGDHKKYEAFGIIDGTPEEAMAFMSDYPAKLGIFPNLKDVKVVWNGNVAVADMTVKIAFQTIRYRMNFRHYGHSFIEYEYVHGDLKDTHGYYKFFPFAEGKKTLMVYHVDTNTGMPVPQFIVDSLTKGAMPDVIEAVRKGVALRRNRARDIQ
jgi:hypothetical protein